MMKERVIQVDHDLHQLSVCKSVCFLYWHFPSHCYVIGGFNLLRIYSTAIAYVSIADLPSPCFTTVSYQAFSVNSIHFGEVSERNG